MIEIYAFNIAEIKDLGEAEKFIPIVSEERRKSIERFYFPKDKIRGLFAEILLRYALVAKQGMKNKEITIHRTKYGKPYLSGVPEVHFNLSHSGEWILCAVSDRPVGADVEKIERSNETAVYSVCTQHEKEYLDALPREKRMKEFFRLWTLKESYAKKIGKGLHIPFDSFGFQLKGDEILLVTEKSGTEELEFFTRELDKEHMMAVCSEYESGKILDIHIIKLHEIEKNLI